MTVDIKIELANNIYYGNDLVVRSILENNNIELEQHLICIAAINGYTRIIKCLLEYGADPNVYNQTIITDSAMNGHFTTLRAILQCDRTNINDGIINEAIDYAKEFKFIRTVKLLNKYKNLLNV
jgi:ankyrin repeat protein